jgi:integrase
VKYPLRLRHNNKGRVLMTIYRRPGGYRVYWRSRGPDGRPMSEAKEFRLYVEAKTFADGKLPKLAAAAKGKLSATLPERQVADARVAFGIVQRFYEDTGESLTLSAVATRYCDSARKLGKTTMDDAVDRFLSTVAAVKRMDVGKAVEEFIESRKAKTVARLAAKDGTKEGERPKLSPEHSYNTGLWLAQFAKAFPPPTCVCDLTKKHFDIWMENFSGLAAKTRNERRGVVKMFLKWCVKQDFLAPTHRLFEAAGLEHERADDTGDIDFYRPAELRAVLEAADKDLLPVLALAGLAGMREKEIMRLTWAEVFAIDGHIEVKARKAKTRSRRLVTVCTSLAQWLEPYRQRTGPVWTLSYDRFHEKFGKLREPLKIPNRRNGLRHSYCTYHFSMHGNENLTAAEAGNSPGMLHSNYKGLATKEQGAAWFAVAPAKAANVVQLSASRANP